MKTLGLKMLSLLFLASGVIAGYGQQSRVEVPGDHFSLEGALELFKNSASPEEFERLLNSPHSKVNNLDLNGDGNIDYIRVIDRNEGNVHAFILQAIISNTESQDVAVIELEKLANGKAVLQITGDEDVYGIETIIEPTEEVYVNAGTSTARTVVNVWTWPAVQYVYSPYYSVWISPWRWMFWPSWWYGWSPVAYSIYDPWWQPYRPYYSVCYSHRVVYAQHIYRPYRTTSVVVHNRHHNMIAHYRSTHRHHGNGHAYGHGHGNGNGYDRGHGNGNGHGIGKDRGNGSGHGHGIGNGNGNGNHGRGSANRNYVTTNSQSIVKYPSATYERGNSSSSVTTRNQQLSKDSYNRNYVKPDKTFSSKQADFKRTPVVSQRNSGAYQRNDGGVKKSGTVNLNRSSHQRETPSIKPDRSGSSGSHGNKGSGNHGSGKSNHRGWKE